MGIASVFVLSSTLLSPLAMAEESRAFVAQNAARQTASEQARQELAAKATERAQLQQTSTSAQSTDTSKDS
ncbi:hypothetical protein D3C86_1682600 [compost metagenome]